MVGALAFASPCYVSGVGAIAWKPAATSASATSSATAAGWSSHSRARRRVGTMADSCSSPQRSQTLIPVASRELHRETTRMVALREHGRKRPKRMFSFLGSAASRRRKATGDPVKTGKVEVLRGSSLAALSAWLPSACRPRAVERAASAAAALLATLRLACVKPGLSFAQVIIASFVRPPALSCKR